MMKVEALFNRGEQNGVATLVDALFKSKYADLIIVSAVILTFLVLIIVSAAVT
jgi:hypothetical protein